MDNAIKVTVYLSTYNQEKYISEAIDSILMQKTDFRYELLIADDCSTDNTQAIILEYQKRCPDIIKTYFTPNNIGGCKKLTDCIDNNLFKGDYIAFLEGDDYWLNENRLQMLVDFLDNNPQYSRVSHKRLVIDENGNEKGFDIQSDVLNKEFTINDFLQGKSYSDFGSVFKNYFKECGSKYNDLLLASRNVCDFQDMFITQDFGPVFVLDECLGVYRSISVSGASNYNSITTQSARCMENIRLAKAVEQFYNGKYDLSPMICHNKKRLVTIAVKECDNEALSKVREFVSADDLKAFAPELIYLAMRGKRKKETEFIKSALTTDELKFINLRLLKYSLKRVYFKITDKRENDKLRGYAVK